MNWFFVYLHLVANLVWIGSIAATGLVLAAPLGEPQIRGRLALWVYRRLAVPAFILALVAGSAQLLSDLQLYFVTRHYMHAKLPLALAIIAFHHILGGRARRMANGQATSAGPAAKLVGAIVVCAALATYLVKAQPF